MVVTHDFLVEHMNEISAISGSSSVNSCKDVDSAVCFLVDDGAFVVAANHPDYKQQVSCRKISAKILLVCRITDNCRPRCWKCYTCTSQFQ